MFAAFVMIPLRTYLPYLEVVREKRAETSGFTTARHVSFGNATPDMLKPSTEKRDEANRKLPFIASFPIKNGDFP